MYGKDAIVRETNRKYGYDIQARVPQFEKHVRL